MELTERAVAAQEKAAEIAKVSVSSLAVGVVVSHFAQEFGIALMKFEQRLDLIESGVDKEVRAVRDIAENLLRAISSEGLQGKVSSSRSTLSSPN